MASSLVSSSTYISDWSSLPEDILTLVLDKLESLADYFCFKSICVHWHSVASDYHKYCVPIKIPHIIIPDDTLDDGQIPSTLYRISDSKALNSFIIPSGKCLIGSSLGWLIFIDKEFVITFFNPFSRSTIIRLPLITFLKDKNKKRCSYNFAKSILSADPAQYPDDYVLAILLQGNLTFIKPGSKNLTWSTSSPKFLHIEDVTYFNNQFHAVDLSGSVLSFDATLEEFSKFNRIPVHHDRSSGLTTKDKDYLVLSCLSGRMWLIRRYKEVRFKVYEMINNNDMEMRWVQKRTLGNQVLFVGYNHSVSVLASDFPECVRGSIYFSHKDFSDIDTDVYNIGIYKVRAERLQPINDIHTIRRQKMNDIDIYNMSIDNVIPSIERQRRKIKRQRPIWFFPNFS